LLALPAFGQTNIRWDWQANTVTGTGQMLPVLALPGAFINFYTNCTGLPCTLPAVTYRSPTGSLTCPANQQVVWQPVTLVGCHSTADSEGNFGGWFQAGAYQYTVTVSGHVSGPYNFQVGGGGGGGGGVSVVSCTDPDPIFGCNIANPTTAPNITFPLKDQAANTIFGNFNGTSGPPFFATFTCTGLLTCVYNSGTNTWNVDIPSVSTLSVSAASPIRVNGGVGPVSSGNALIDCPTCGGVNAQQSIQNLPAGQHAIIHPTGATVVSCTGAINTPIISPNFDGGILSFQQQGGIFPPSHCTIEFTYAGALASQAPQVIPGNVTSVYAFATSSWSTVVGSAVLTSGSANLNPTVTSTQPWPLQTSNHVTTWTGATLNSALSDMTITRSATTSSLISLFNVTDIGLAVYYTGTAPGADTAVHYDPPIGYTTVNGYPEIFLDPNFDSGSKPTTIALLALLGPSQNYNGFQVILDGSTSTDCHIGGGTFTVACETHPDGTLTGSPWAAVGGGGGSSTTYFTQTLTCASTCTLTHTPVVFDNLSVNGLIMISGTDFTQSGTTVTLTTPAVGGDVYYAQYHY